MTAVSDVFAFAAEHADYWKDLLSGEEYPAELTDDERRALDAAGKHVEELVVELLHACGATFAAMIGPPWVSPNFKRKPTAAKRLVGVHAPASLASRLYWVEFALKPTEDLKRIALWPALVVKKSSQHALVGEMTERGMSPIVEGYHVYRRPVAITSGRELSELASEAASVAVDLLRGCGMHGGASAAVADSEKSMMQAPLERSAAHDRRRGSEPS